MKLMLNSIVLVIGVCIGWKLTINQLLLLNEVELKIYEEIGELPKFKSLLMKQLMYILGLGLCVIALIYLN